MAAHRAAAGLSPPGQTWRKGLHVAGSGAVAAKHALSKDSTSRVVAAQCGPGAASEPSAVTAGGGVAGPTAEAAEGVADGEVVGGAPMPAGSHLPCRSCLPSPSSVTAALPLRAVGSVEEDPGLQAKVGPPCSGGGGKVEARGATTALSTAGGPRMAPRPV